MLGTLAIVAALALSGGIANAKPYAPPGQKGPKLSRLNDRSDLRASLTCTGNLRNARKTPVLLLSGTTVSPDENFAWNWMPALSDAGFPWCASTAPDPGNMGDIQRRGEYVAFAIRRMYRRSGRKIAIYGHSQGGMVGRWALRFWPDTRRKVSDLVGAAPSNHGTDIALGACVPNCAPSIWQQRTGSAFIKALDSRAETFRRVSYTSIYSRHDEVVFPNINGERSSLAGGRNVANVAIQQVCPLDLAEHLVVGTVDPVAWRLFRDALRRRGPARPGAIDSSVCAVPFMPGVDRLTVATDLAAAGAALGKTLALYPHSDGEPRLRSYVFAH